MMLKEKLEVTCPERAPFEPNPGTNATDSGRCTGSACPKIRTGIIKDPGIELSPGNTLILTTEKVEGSNNRVSVSDPDLPEIVRPGDRILLADGLMELRVQDILLKEIHCEVLTGGTLTSHKGINLPTRSIPIPSLTPKDHDDLMFGLEKGVGGCRWVGVAVKGAVGGHGQVPDIRISGQHPVPVLPIGGDIKLAPCWFVRLGGGYVWGEG